MRIIREIRPREGTFVATTVDLGRDLRRRELDEHLEAAADIGRELGLEADVLEARLREIVKRKDEITT